MKNLCIIPLLLLSIIVLAQPTKITTSKITLTANPEYRAANAGRNVLMIDTLTGDLYRTQLNSAANISHQGSVKILRSLKEMNAPPDGTIMNILGYSNTSDGAGGQFYWSDTSTAADNEGTVIKPTAGARAGRWIRIFSGAVNVKWFGAGTSKNGDVNRKAFQNAIDAVSQISYGAGYVSKGTIYIPRGDGNSFYDLSDSLLVNGDITLTGENEGGYPLYTSKIRFPINKSGIVVKGYPLGGANNVQIENLLIQSGGLSNDSTTHGIWSNTRLRMENVKVAGFGGHGIEINTDRGGNANYSYFRNVISADNWESGWHFKGIDVNICLLLSCSGEANRVHNFFDESLLGNTYVGIHSSDAGNVAGNKSHVFHKNAGYISIKDNKGIEPGVTPGWENFWQYIGPATAATPRYPQWGESINYRYSSAFVSKGEVQKTVVVGSYTEDYQGGIQLGQRSMWIGGLLGTAGANYYDNILQTEGHIWWAKGNGLGVRPMNAASGEITYISAQNGFEANSISGGTAWKAFPSENVTKLYYPGIPSASGIEFTLPSYKIAKLGWTAGVPFAHPIISAGLSFKVNENTEKIRSLYFFDGVPSGGSPFGTGDFGFFTGADSTIIGFRNITAGLPGAFKTLYTGNDRLTGVTRRKDSVFNIIKGKETFAYTQVPEYSKTITPAGKTGNQNINKPTGTVNIAAGAKSVTVASNIVSESSIVFAVIRTNDATAQLRNVVSAKGSFTINLSSAASGEISVGFMVVN